ncbi:MAG: hypothetical protein ABF969_03345 [Sporolactobacillus sp.]
MEIFVSSDGTQYKWDRDNEYFVILTDTEIKLLKFKVQLMSDDEILNRESGNGISMGIPVSLSRERLAGIKNKLIDILKTGPFIDFEQHAIERIVEDSLFSDGDPRKRGWISQDEAKHCVMTARYVSGVRLNVDFQNPDNTEKVKHLHTQFALVIQGEKTTGDGRLVLVILSEKVITIITVL